MKGHYATPSSMFRNQKKLLAGSLPFATGQAALLTVRNEHGRNKTKYNTEYEMAKTKQRGSR